MVIVYQYGYCTYSIVVICPTSCLSFSSSSSLLFLPFLLFLLLFLFFSFWQRLTMSPPAPHENLQSAIALLPLASPCFPFLARPMRGRVLTRCHSPCICARAHMRTKPSSLVATQLMFCFMMEMLRQNMLEAYFHNIRLTFCYWRVHSCLLSVEIIVIQYHDLGQSDYRNYEQLQYRWNSLGPYNHIIQYYGTLILNAFIVWSCLKA